MAVVAEMVVAVMTVEVANIIQYIITVAFGWMLMLMLALVPMFCAVRRFHLEEIVKGTGSD